MGQIANQMLVEAIFKFQEKIKGRKAKNNKTSATSEKKSKKEKQFSVYKDDKKYEVYTAIKGVRTFWKK